MATSTSYEVTEEVERPFSPPAAENAESVKKHDTISLLSEMMKATSLALDEKAPKETKKYALKRFRELAADTQAIKEIVERKKVDEPPPNYRIVDPPTFRTDRALKDVPPPNATKIMSQNFSSTKKFAGVDHEDEYLLPRILETISALTYDEGLSQRGAMALLEKQLTGEARKHLQGYIDTKAPMEEVYEMLQQTYCTPRTAVDAAMELQRYLDRKITNVQSFCMKVYSLTRDTIKGATFEDTAMTAYTAAIGHILTYLEAHYKDFAIQIRRELCSYDARHKLSARGKFNALKNIMEEYKRVLEVAPSKRGHVSETLLDRVEEAGEEAGGEARAEVKAPGRDRELRDEARFRPNFQTKRQRQEDGPPPQVLTPQDKARTRAMGEANPYRRMYPRYGFGNARNGNYPPNGFGGGNQYNGFGGNRQQGQFAGRFGVRRDVNGNGRGQALNGAGQGGPARVYIPYEYWSLLRDKCFLCGCSADRCPGVTQCNVYDQADLRETPCRKCLSQELVRMHSTQACKEKSAMVVEIRRLPKKVSRNNNKGASKN